MTSSVSNTSSSAIIKSLTGAQIDIQELATNLTEASRAPQQAQLDVRKTAADAKISAIGKIQASAKAFQDAIASYGDPKAIQYQPASSNSNVADFAFRSYYEPSEVDFSFKVKALATDNRVTFATVPSAGTFTLASGTNTPASITYNTLGELTTWIKQQTGFNATLLNGKDLVVSKGTGAANNFTATVTDSGNSATITKAATGTDARIEADGQIYTSATNRFSTLITGVNIDVKAVSDTDVRISTVRNTDKFILALKTIVDGYNDLLSTVKKEMNYDPDVKKRGGFANDSVARDFLNQMRRLTTDTISGYSATVPTVTLAEVGLVTNRDGTLQLDTYKLDQIAQNNPERLEAAVASNTASKGAIDKMKTLIDTVLGRGSTFQNLYNSTNTTVLGKIQDDTDKLNEQMDALRQRYLTQFIAMQKVVLQSQKTQESLTNYMTSWTAGLKNG